MISVAWNGVGMPLLWMLLPTAGNSNTSERTELLDRLRVAFPDLKIAALMGDREFVGDAWMTYLQRENIPFILRLRENQHVLRAGYVALPISVIARHLKVGEKMIVKGSCQLGRANETLSASVRLVITRLASGELLALACSGRARHALARYRQRWTIETMFGNLKTKGFALEATHLTDSNKLSTLLALLAFAVALTVKNGVAKACLRAIPIKKHGRRARSLFALGLNTARKIFAAATPDQIIAFLAQLGVIALAGIVVRNSLLLIDFIIARRAEGLSLEDAIIEAGAVRLRPILLTALAIILGSAVMISDPVFGGLAISLIFGALASTTLTLFVIPLIYYCWKGWRRA